MKLTRLKMDKRGRITFPRQFRKVNRIKDNSYVEVSVTEHGECLLDFQREGAKLNEIQGLLSKNIDDVLDLHLRVTLPLTAYGIKTMGSLLSKTGNELLRFQNFGRKAWMILDEELEKHGLSLGMKIYARTIYTYKEK